VSFAAAQGIHQNNNNPLCQTPLQSCVSFATATLGLLARLFIFIFLDLQDDICKRKKVDFGFWVF
jgi:hypothetical protein